jgi:hypothetical protein
MKTNFGRLLLIALFTCSLLLAGGLLLAAVPRQLVWEGEQVSPKALSGKALKIMTLRNDPAGKPSSGKVIGVEKVPRGQKVVPDAVAYRVKIPVKGTYYLWSRVSWSTGCGNSFYINVSGVKGDWIIGGDGTYDSMHWVCISDGNHPKGFALTPGVVTFTLRSRESGTMLDEFLLTTDRTTIPGGIYKPTAGVLAQ